MSTVHSLSYDDISRLGVDDENNLYCDSKPVVTERKVALPVFVNAAAIVTGISTGIMAVVQFSGFWVERGWAPLW